jgi:hypothetical protein
VLWAGVEYKPAFFPRSIAMLTSSPVPEPQEPKRRWAWVATSASVLATASTIIFFVVPLPEWAKLLIKAALQALQSIFGG